MESRGITRMITISRIEGEADLAVVQALLREYAASLDVDLAYQHFEEEMGSLPGDYAWPLGVLLLAHDGTSAVGCVGVRPLAEQRCEMKRLYVRPAARGCGLGRQLAEAAIAFGQAAGYRAIRLDTLPSMHDAQALYRTLGFVDIPAYRPSPVAGNVFMELALFPVPISCDESGG